MTSTEHYRERAAEGIAAALGDVGLAATRRGVDRLVVAPVAGAGEIDVAVEYSSPMVTLVRLRLQVTPLLCRDRRGHEQLRLALWVNSVLTRASCSLDATGENVVILTEVSSTPGEVGDAVVRRISSLREQAAMLGPAFASTLRGLPAEAAIRGIRSRGMVTEDAIEEAQRLLVRGGGPDSGAENG